MNQGCPISKWAFGLILQSTTYILLTGGKGSWGVAYKKALDAFKKFKMSKYSSYTDSEAKDTAKAFHLLIEQNA